MAKANFQLTLAAPLACINQMKENRLIRLLPIVMMILSSKLAFGTAQFGDILIFNKDTVSIFSNPLEQYFELKKERTINGDELEGMCTALWRGYVATWEIENDSLFLVRIQINYCGDNPIDLDLVGEFGKDRIFANWFNGEIRSQIGSMLSYMHAGYGSVYEREQFFKIKEGSITNITDTSYIEFDGKRLSPQPEFLRDTIQRLIYNELDTTKIDSIKADEHFELIIVFNSNGEIDRISKNYEEDSPYLSTLMYKTAQNALKDFPLIMKVKHERYSPPIIRIWFSEHCLKHPEDSEYGCEDYRKLINSVKTEPAQTKEDKEANSVWIYIIFSIIGIILTALIFRIRKK